MSTAASADQKTPPEYSAKLLMMDHGLSQNDYDLLTVRRLATRMGIDCSGTTLRYQTWYYSTLGWLEISQMGVTGTFHITTVEDALEMWWRCGHLLPTDLCITTFTGFLFTG